MSPGPDGIYTPLLQRAEEEIMRPLARLIRASLPLGNVPKAWWETRVISKSTTERSRSNSFKDFRLISRTSSILKTVENLVDRSLRDTALVEHPNHSDEATVQMGVL